jgi:hypothetical protein
MNPYPATANRRAQYIQQVAEFLIDRPPGRRDIVLLDPDNGIGETQVRGEQIHATHLPLVWAALRSGDTLALVQFQHNVRNWIMALAERIAGIVGVPSAEVIPNGWGNLCVYLIDR